MTRRAAALAALLLAVLPATASAVTVGVSDQQATSYADARLRALGTTVARLVVPWNAALSEPDRVQAWLDAVAAAWMRPHVAFEHLRTDRCPGSPCTLPTRGQYRSAIDAFRARFPQVTTFTTWNEVNHTTQPTVARPEATAGVGGTAGAERTVEVTDPFDEGRVIHRLALRRGAVATSGTTRRRWAGGHHLIDPHTGRPADTGLVQATALAPTGLEAEVRAKAALLAGPGDAARHLPDGGVLVGADGRVRVVEAAAQGVRSRGRLSAEEVVL